MSGGRPKKDLKSYIIECHFSHNFLYDYSKTILCNMKSDIIIVCPYHGEFIQNAYQHRNGSGCPTCSGNKRITYEEFVERSNKIHNNKYSYTEIEKISHSTKIQILCKKHGLFKQTVNSHLHGKGCRMCAYESISLKNKKSKVDIIKKCNEKHNYKYDYSMIDFELITDKVKIGCPIHGFYLQNLSEHQSGKGCSLCNNKISKAVRDIMYILDDSNVEYLIEYKFENCKNILPLPFDFYIPAHNICIEYDGEQHFIQNKYWGGINEYEKIQIRDKIKTDFCINNNINLIRISYKDDHKNIIKNIIGEIKNAI